MESQFYKGFRNQVFSNSSLRSYELLLKKEACSLVMI